MGDACCGKTIDVRALQARQKRVLKIVLGVNLATLGLMVAAAWWSQSSSLLSGGLDNLGDALTYILSLAVVGASIQAKARVSFVKGLLILLAALAVAAQIAWRLSHPAVPMFEGIGIAGMLNLGANLLCLRLLTPYRHGDLNMASAWGMLPKRRLGGFRGAVRRCWRLGVRERVAGSGDRRGAPAAFPAVSGSGFRDVLGGAPGIGHLSIRTNSSRARARCRKSDGHKGIFCPSHGSDRLIPT